MGFATNPKPSATNPKSAVFIVRIWKILWNVAPSETGPGRWSWMTSPTVDRCSN